MKNRKCPYKNNCLDYVDCDDCETGKEITKLHNQIERLKKKNETLTIQCNAWHLAAERVGEELQKSRENAENASGEWVSVEDRLPEENGSYLVIGKSGTPHTAHFYNERTIHGKTISAHFSNRYVTHWMPLPEAPKGE